MNQKIKRNAKKLAASILVISFFFAFWAAYAQQKPLPPSEAYQFRWEQLGDEIILIWTIQDRYYLYDEKFETKVGNGYKIVSKKISPFTEQIDDIYFGIQSIHRKNAFIKMTLARDEAVQNPSNTIQVVYQGCWEGGICYPPQTQDINFDAAAFEPASAKKKLKIQ